jgi:hypothetical protein
MIGLSEWQAGVEAERPSRVVADDRLPCSCLGVLLMLIRRSAWSGGIQPYLPGLPHRGGRISPDTQM